MPYPEKEITAPANTDDMPSDWRTARTLRRRRRRRRRSAAEVEAEVKDVTRHLPPDELDHMLRSGLFTTADEVSRFLFDHYGLDVSQGSAKLLSERSRSYLAESAKAEKELVKLEGTVYFSVPHYSHEGQSIYAIDLSQIAVKPVNPSEIKADYRTTQVSRSKIVAHPVLGLSLEDGFPVGMSCVRWRSRMYLIGGHTYKTVEGFCFKKDSPDVYYIEFGKISKILGDNNSCTRDPKHLISRGLVKKAAPMNRGKPNLYTFVVKEKIYVISSATPYFRSYRFEVYDPEEDEWCYLPDPQFHDEVICDAVLNDKKVVLGTLEEGYFCFDLETHEWHNYSPFRFLYRNLCGTAPHSHCIRVGERLYWNTYRFDVACFGPPIPGPDSDLNEADIKALFKGYGTYSKLLHADIQSLGPDFACPGATALHYLGNQTFAYVTCGMTRDIFPDEGEEEEEEYVPDDEAIDIRIIVFKVPEDDSSGSSEGSEEPEFTPEVVHVVELMCKSGGGYGIMADCFII